MIYIARHMYSICTFSVGLSDCLSCARTVLCHTCLSADATCTCVVFVYHSMWMENCSPELYFTHTVRPHPFCVVLCLCIIVLRLGNCSPETRKVRPHACYVHSCVHTVQYICPVISHPSLLSFLHRLADEPDKTVNCHSTGIHTLNIRELRRNICSL